MDFPRVVDEVEPVPGGLRRSYSRPVRPHLLWSQAAGARAADKAPPGSADATALEVPVLGDDGLGERAEIQRRNRPHQTAWSDLGLASICYEGGRRRGGIRDRLGVSQRPGGGARRPVP